MTDLRVSFLYVGGRGNHIMCNKQNRYLKTRNNVYHNEWTEWQIIWTAAEIKGSYYYIS